MALLFWWEITICISYNQSHYNLTLIVVYSHFVQKLYVAPNTTSECFTDGLLQYIVPDSMADSFITLPKAARRKRKIKSFIKPVASRILCELKFLSYRISSKDSKMSLKLLRMKLTSLSLNICLDWQGQVETVPWFDFARYLFSWIQEYIHTNH